MNFVNHVFAKRLVGRLLGSKGMRLGGVYLRQAEEEREVFKGTKKKLSG
jgi:hypothetical protein